MEHDEYCDENHMFYEKCNDYLFNEDIGTCQGCGSYGIAGTMCYQYIDGNREECGERL